jgi:hypothetical protein
LYSSRRVPHKRRRSSTEVGNVATQKIVLFTAFLINVGEVVLKQGTLQSRRLYHHGIPHKSRRSSTEVGNVATKKIVTLHGIPNKRRRSGIEIRNVAIEKIVLFTAFLIKGGEVVLK